MGAHLSGQGDPIDNFINSIWLNCDILRSTPLFRFIIHPNTKGMITIQNYGISFMKIVVDTHTKSFKDFASNNKLQG
ncbi:hypothetical protein [Pedobacter mendelii]|uniref:hypothetical protein n=1 Tax=Pedobacter mendelii TaxID=1908240 RepID=UPI0016685431|nr:hypothetical protein [Pedobacter mendelii]